MEAVHATPAGWMAVAAYLYMLGLDSPSLAWEYLRRHPDYRQAWRRRCSDEHRADEWGLAQWEDPALDARQAHPVWLYPLADQVMLRAEHENIGTETLSFNLWAWQGRKQLRALEDGYALQIWHASHILRARYGTQSLLGQSVTVTLPFDRRWKSRLRALQRQRLSARTGATGARLPRLTGGIGKAYAPGRAKLLHLRALLALDALQAGASHRQIAIALVGEAQVRELWHADATLRSLVRHYVRRGRYFRDGGYRQLLAAAPPAAGGP